MDISLIDSKLNPMPMPQYLLILVTTILGCLLQITLEVTKPFLTHDSLTYLIQYMSIASFAITLILGTPKVLKVLLAYYLLCNKKVKKILPVIKKVYKKQYQKK